MHRLGGRIGRFLGVLALLCTALFAATTAAAPAAFADGASSCTSDLILCTAITWGGAYTSTPLDPSDPAGGGGGSGGYVSSCWLQPQTAWGNADEDASSPAGFEQFFNDFAVAVEHDPEAEAMYQPAYDLYNTGKNAYGSADAGIGLTAPPFNEGVTGGRWYGIACVQSDNNFEDYTSIQEAMGVSSAQLNYEGWFWITNGQTMPPGVQVMTPNLLAQYAANHVALDPLFPALSPGVGDLQTVNLPVESVNQAGTNGYYEYQTWATLGPITSTVYAYPVSVTYTSTPQDLITPESVTCSFDQNGDGGIASPCQTFEFTMPGSASLGYSLTATTTWKVYWAGNADYGEDAWTIPLPGPNPAYTANDVTVQEIQAIDGGSSTATP
jgi:hypothetical protein